VEVRHARARDLKHIAPIEDAGGPMFREHFGAAMGVLEAPADDGWQRLEKPGFLLVAGEVGDDPVGFVHVLVMEQEHAHLEQVSVLPSHQRRGIGAELIATARAESRAMGFRRLSLCTFRDVPWNGPYYARLGFAEVPESDQAPYEREIRVRERRIGLDDVGERCVMSVALR
jgi:GNAT superfamily N-acetyltransferase